MLKYEGADLLEKRGMGHPVASPNYGPGVTEEYRSAVFVG